MSADNFYDVFEQDGSWYAAHKFASDCWYGDAPDVEVDRANHQSELHAVLYGPEFATRSAAVAWASEQFSEYGVSVRRQK